MLTSRSANEVVPSLSQYFDHYFMPEIATNSTLCQEAYRIRYQVYCLDLNYEPTENFPDRMEIDDYDSHSIHCLIKYKPANVYVGCVRIILPNIDCPQLPFPVEKTCRNSMEITLDSSTRLKYCEVSRLSIIPAFRRRTGEREFPASLNPSVSNNTNSLIEYERRVYPLILPLSLYLAAFGMGVAAGHTQTLTLMEPRLMRHLKMSGFPSRQIGKVVDFHGKRAPFRLCSQEVIQSLPTDSRELYDNIYTQIRDSVERRCKDITLLVTTQARE